MSHAPTSIHHHPGGMHLDGDRVGIALALHAVQ
jgi:hypothetical protein